MSNPLGKSVISAAVIAGGWASAASAQTIVGSTIEPDMAAKVELIDNSRLGCGQDKPMWTATGGGSQCAFDTATRGMRLSARQEFDRGSVEAYATVAYATSGAFTPDRLLVAPEYRQNEATSFVMAGVKGSLLDNRLKLTAEFARTSSIVDELLVQDWALADSMSRSGSSVLVRADATLVSRPGLKWSVTGEFRSVSEAYTIGRSFDLVRYAALPGTRLALSTKANVGPVGLKAGIERNQSPFGRFVVDKAGVDFQGIALNVRWRESSTSPVEGSMLLDNRTRSRLVNLEIDSAIFAAWVLPDLDELPWLVPTNVNVSMAAGETENRFLTSTERYSRSSLGIDGIWESPLGETSIGYWRDTRTWQTGNAGFENSETLQADHLVRRGNWRFGLDASLSRSSSGGGADGDRTWSFGQTVAYSAPNGPELRLRLGQDRSRMRADSGFFIANDSYSNISASLDLSRYLQKRFERDDLRLTFDYRKIVDRSESQFGLEGELIDRWVDIDRRDGFLMSFGMKL